MVSLRTHLVSGRDSHHGRIALDHNNTIPCLQSLSHALILGLCHLLRTYAATMFLYLIQQSFVVTFKERITPTMDNLLCHRGYRRLLQNLTVIGTRLLMAASRTSVWFPRHISKQNEETCRR